MKKYLIIALAALGFAACAEKIDDNGAIHNGELEESYIAINLMSADLDTRAATDTFGYEEGTSEERAIKSAHFFFFDENGNPFNVTKSSPGGEKNHLPLTIGETTGNVDPNVSDVKEAVLVLNTYKGVYPSKIVAVLNWTPAENTYTLEALHSLLATIGNDTNGYVMSNSVYMDGAGKVVDAVPLTAANIKTTADAALAAPVEIYVERTAAKVVLTTKVENATFNTEKTPSLIGSTGTTPDVKVYVKLLGWELYNDYATTNILKNIENWDTATLGLTWNDIPYYRCYWAKSQANTHNDSFSWEYAAGTLNEKGFPTVYGFEVGGYTYCGENTNGEALRTKVILKGQLVKENGEALELARWYGTEYAGNEALRTAVANSLKYTIYSSDNGTTFTSIKPEDIQCVAGKSVGAEAYEVGFQLSTDGEAKTWYKYDSQNGYVAFGDNGVTGDNKAKANAHLATVEPALLYAEGNTYYIVDIKHLGTEGKSAEYGVVRNHVYKIDVQSIQGYGSPVYSGLDFIVENPGYPTEDEASYVAARINVLSWKVVSQGVNIVQ